MKIPPVIAAYTHIILFDGVCHLCSGFLQFVYKRDRKRIFKFAWIQDQPAREILNWLEMSESQYKTIVLIKNGNAFFKSTAFLQIVRELKYPWPLLGVVKVIPRPLRDWVYDWIAANRYRWFGRREACMIPTKSLRSRFIFETDR